MAKFILLMLLVAVTISWSEGRWFKSNSLAGRSASTIYKRDVDELSEERVKEIVKEVFAETLLMAATKDEKPVLIRKFQQTMDMKFDTMKDFANHLIKIFKDVTGRDFAPAESDESSDESYESSDEFVDSPVAEGRAIPV